MAGGTTVDDTKRAVCKSFTDVVKSSALAINPKSFFMMINANYSVLCQNGRIDLSPLWDALVAGHPVDQLFGLFLMFRLRAAELGLDVQLPSQVDALSEEEVRQAIQPWVSAGVPNDTGSLEPIALPLSTGDLRPFVPDDVRRRVVLAVSHAIRTSPLGARFDLAQLTFDLDTGFESLFNGHTFDFAQVVSALRQSQVIEDHEIFEAIARAKPELHAMNVGIVEPALNLDAAEKQHISDDIRRAEERGHERSVLPLVVPALTAEPEKPAEDAAPPKKISRDERLKEEYGLSSVRERRKLPLRSIALGVLLSTLALIAFFTRPSRSLSHEDYDALIPMKSAELMRNTFQCTVDDARWFALGIEERAARLDKLQNRLHEEGRILNMQCRDQQGRLVITSSGAGKIVGATFFMKGDASGKLPKEGKQAKDAKANEAKEPPLADGKKT